MGQFQFTKLFRRFEIDMSFTPASGATGAVNWEFRTERPGTTGVQDREVGQIFLAANETNRRPHRVDLPGATRGRMFQIHLAPSISDHDNTGQLHIFGIRIYAKILNPHQRTTWRWYPIPLHGTSDVWSRAKLPIVPTAQSWSVARLPIRPTSEVWARTRMPIAPTADIWSRIPWPFRATPKEAQWAQLPVDQ